MTQDEKDDYQRTAAMVILGAMVTARGYKLPPPEVPPEASEERKAERAKERADFERKQASDRMYLAAEAFALAGALVAESELWGGPVDQDGESIDARALDRECVHGRKMSEDCPECDQRAQAAKAGLPAEAASGEGTDATG